MKCALTILFALALPTLADDTAAVQSLVDSTGITGEGRIPPGVWRLSSGVVLPVASGWAIRGSGPGRTTLVWSGSSCGMMLTNYAGANCRISDLTLQGDGGTNSIGLMVGLPIEQSVWAGAGLRVENVWLNGWDTGASVSNWWGPQFVNCQVIGNRSYGLRFSRTHNALIQGCRIQGANFTFGTGVGVGFIGAAGDDAGIQRSMICNCTQAVVNAELNLVLEGVHFEDCGSYLTALKGSVNNILGCYFLDHPHPWNAGFLALTQFDSASARNATFQGCNLDGNSARPTFAVTDDGTGFAHPSVVGRGKQWAGAEMIGLWNTNLSITVQPFTP